MQLQTNKADIFKYDSGKDFNWYDLGNRSSNGKLGRLRKVNTNEVTSLVIWNLLPSITSIYIYHIYN